jgi:sodium-dependent dicarboxylate transporter 2/3/5
VKTKLNTQSVLTGLGLGALLTSFFLGVDKMTAMGVVAAVVALWWIFEVLPLAITALLPLVTYPLLGIMSTKAIAPIYMSSVLMLFVGGFLVAIAMQKWNLHKRIALTIIQSFGSAPSRMLLGFMIATSFLSMWISNTASCVMMVSIGLAVIKSFEEIHGENDQSSLFATALMMAIAYSATIGGVATLVGTPPNLAFTRIYSMSFPDNPEVSFGAWITFGLPICILMLATAYSVLYFVKVRPNPIPSLGTDVIDSEVEKLGPMSKEEKSVAAVFVALALLWIFRKDLNLGFFTVPGWSNLLPFPNNVDDGTVAIIMAISLFIIPSRSGKLLDKKAIEEIPWSTILLFGGGFALAKGIQSSGLSAAIGAKFVGLGDVAPVFVVSGLTLGMSFLTELTSNMASTEMLLPILASIAKSSGIHPLSIMVPATLAASCAFMLPAATAPNAIIFGSNRVRIIDMVKVGIIINLISVVIITFFSLLIIPALMEN